MIDLSARPANAEHFARLLLFAREALRVCDQVGVTPVLDGSLAVLAYTGAPAIEVHDIDFSCPESDIPRLQQGLESIGIACQVQPWHVLQARQDGLKIEFGAIEYWLQGIPEGYETLRIGDLQFRMLALDGLRELYRRGLADRARQDDDNSRRKHQSIKEKLLLLEQAPGTWDGSKGQGTPGNVRRNG